MKQSITVSQFDDAFRDYGREDNFSYQGRHALYEYLEQMDEDCGTETELDVIALCCEFSEYADLEELQENYTDIRDIDHLREHTQVIEFSGGLIIQDF